MGEEIPQLPFGVVGDTRKERNNSGSREDANDYERNEGLRIQKDRRKDNHRTTDEIGSEERKTR